MNEIQEPLGTDVGVPDSITDFKCSACALGLIFVLKVVSQLCRNCVATVSRAFVDF